MDAAPGEEWPSGRSPSFVVFFLAISGMNTKTGGQSMNLILERLVGNLSITRDDGNIVGQGCLIGLDWFVWGGCGCFVGLGWDVRVRRDLGVSIPASQRRNGQ